MITRFAVLAENTNVNVIKNSQWFCGSARWRAVSFSSICCQGAEAYEIYKSE